jgi:hypothetical protein
MQFGSWASELYDTHVQMVTEKDYSRVNFLLLVTE